jgi:hypothetical protein
MALTNSSLNLLSHASLAGSILSILLGISWVIYGFTYIQFAPYNCTFGFCNSQWRGLISLAPETFMDTFQPIILGVVGVVYQLPSRPLKPVFMGPPSSSVGGGLFHIAMALFGNLGYMYWVGIAICTYNLLIGVVIMFVNMMQNGGSVASTRPKDMDEIPNTSAANTVIEVSTAQAVTV